MSARGDDRKAAIIAAAIERIVQFGIEGLRVRDVAQDVGINNATLHHHFPTKSALVAAIVQGFVASFKSEGGVPATGSLEERIAGYVSTRRAQMEQKPDTFYVFNELMILARRDDEIRRILASLHDGWQGYLSSVCREAGDDPETAAKRAERCRMELLGLGLELGVRRVC